jgi:hypothetical protein
VVGLGWFNRPSHTTELVAHELAHNMGRLHAPCGGAAGPDPAYPHPGGSIGTYGHDLYTWSLSGTGTPTQYATGTGDLMSYCTPPWISDYTYLGLLAARGGAVASPPVSVSACPCLIVWGSVSGGVIRLEPSFVAPPPARPTRATGGSWVLRASNAAGTPELEHAFEPVAIDHAPGARPFAVSVPLTEARAAALGRIEVRGEGRVAERSVHMTAPTPPATPPSVEQSGPNTLTVRWDPARTPLLIVRDPVSGRVLGMGQRGVLTLTAPPRELELIRPGAGGAVRFRY